MAARGAGSSYRETSGHAEEAGASLSLTLSSENLPLEGRAEPACRGQRGGSPKERRRGGEGAGGPSDRAQGVPAPLGAGPGAGPALVVELLVIHHGGLGGRCPSLRGAGPGAGCRVLRLRGPSAAHASLAGEAGSLGRVGDVTARRRRQSPGPGEGCLGQTPGSGRLRRRASSPVAASRFGAAGVLRPSQFCSGSGTPGVVSVSAYLGHSVS